MAKNTDKGLFYGYICVAAAAVVMMLNFGTLYSFGVFFKPLLAEFGWSRAETSGAFSLSFFVQGLMGIPMGRLNDRYGPRLVTALCGVLLGGGFILMSFVKEMWQLYILYGIVIAAGVSGSVAMMAIPSRWFVKRRGLMTGIVISGVGVGTVIMPPVANALIDTIQWRNSYVAIGVAALLMMVGVAFFLKKEPKQMGLTAYGDDGTHAFRSFGSGVDYSFGKAFRTAQFWMLGILFFFHTYCVQTIMAHVALYAQGTGLSTEAAAGVISVVGGASIAGRILMGTMVDRFGSRPILTANFLIKTAALVLLVFARSELTFILFAIIFGFGYGGAAVAHTPMIADLFGLTALSSILAGVSLIGTTGAASGPVVAGWIFDVTGAYFWAFISCIALSLFGFILAMFLHPVESQPKKGIEQ
jgi:MFS family permease